MITKLVTVKSTEQKMSAKNTPYLSVVLTDEKGKDATFSIFDQSTWELYSDGAPLQIEMEKQGNFWNITKAEPVKDVFKQEAMKEVRQEANDGKSRAFALSYAKDFHIARMQAGVETGVINVLRTAKIFEDYLETGKIIQKEAN